MDTIIVAQQTIDVIKDSIISALPPAKFSFPDSINVNLPDSIHTFQSETVTDFWAITFKDVITMASAIIALSGIFLTRHLFKKTGDREKERETERIKKIKAHILNYFTVISNQLKSQSGRYNKLVVELKKQDKPYLIPLYRSKILFDEILTINNIDLSNILIFDTAAKDFNSEKLVMIHAAKDRVETMYKVESETNVMFNQAYSKTYLQLVETYNKITTIISFNSHENFTYLGIKDLPNGFNDVKNVFTEGFVTKVCRVIDEQNCDLRVSSEGEGYSEPVDKELFALTELLKKTHKEYLAVYNNIINLYTRAQDLLNESSAKFNLLNQFYLDEGLGKDFEKHVKEIEQKYSDKAKQ